MNNFPKKYNHQKNPIFRYQNDLNSNIYTSLLSSDHKLHPWYILTLFFQDLNFLSKSLEFQQLNKKVWFTLSSEFYSNSNNTVSNIKSLKEHNSKQYIRNMKFLDKLWLWVELNNYNVNNFSERFNIYLRKVFGDLYNHNKISLDKREVHWSNDLQTNLFNNNILVQKKKTKQYNVKYFIDSKGNAVIIPIIDLQTIFGDVAVAVNPQDKRYKKLIWQNVIIPIINKIIPIVWDEDVDSFNGSWVCRITPWHDQNGFNMAQKHNLPTDIYAFDIHWNFSEHAWEFAGKSVDEFLENIIKYIDDIWNLDSVVQIEVNKKFDLNTKEELVDLVMDQWFISYDYSIDILSDIITQNKIYINPFTSKQKLLDILSHKKIINISNKSSNNILIPILTDWDGTNIFFNDEELMTYYKSNKSKKDILFTVIFSNLLLDNNITNWCSIEDLISELFSRNINWDKSKLEEYLYIYWELSKINKDYNKWLKSINKLLSKVDKNSEKIHMLIEIIENSFWLFLENDNVFINFNEIVWEDSWKQFTLQQKDSFNKSFVDGVWFLYDNWLLYNHNTYQDLQTLNNTLITALDQNDMVLNTQLLALDYSKTLLFNEIIQHPLLLDWNSKKINNQNSKFIIKEFDSLISNYWSDVVRLVILMWSQKDDNIILDTNNIDTYASFVDKIRNASRYVYNNYIKDKNINHIDDLVKQINNLDFSEYDLWIVHSLKSIVDDYQYQTSEHNLLWLWKKILDFSKNTLCDQYLESIKLSNNEKTPIVVVLSFLVVLLLLKPYIPWVVCSILKIFDIDTNGYDVFSFADIQLQEKNYKINLLMDIIQKLNKIRDNNNIKKHKQVDIYVQANPEFLSFLWNNEDIIRSLMKINDIKLIKNNEELPLWYYQDSVININIWLKYWDITQIEPSSNINLQKTLRQKQEQLQYVKSIIMVAQQSWNIEKVEQNKKELEHLKSEIEEIEFNIRKAKAA